MIVLVRPAPEIESGPVTSRSPEASVSVAARGIDSLYVPAGRMIASAPGRALVSCMAARSVQRPLAVLQTPSPGLASTSSDVVLTVKEAAGTQFAPNVVRTRNAATTILAVA